jgi:hypothetical protein
MVGRGEHRTEPGSKLLAVVAHHGMAMVLVAVPVSPRRLCLGESRIRVLLLKQYIVKIYLHSTLQNGEKRHHARALRQVRRTP